MSEDDIREKEDFYDSNGWDLDKVPTHSGKLILPDGTLVRIEGRMLEGNRGDFWVGGCYVPENQPGRGNDRRRDGGRNDRGGDRRRDERSDSRGSRDDRSERRSRDDDRGSRRREPSNYNGDLDDDVPF